MTIVLGIDQADKLGFAYGRPGELPKNGIIQLQKSRDTGKYLWHFEAEVRRLIEMSKAEMVIMESVFFSPKTATSGMNLAKILGVIEKEVYAMGIPQDIRFVVSAGTWFKPFCSDYGRFNNGCDDSVQQEATHDVSSRQKRLKQV